MSTNTTRLYGSLELGKTGTVMAGPETGPGTKTTDFVISSESVLVSLYVTSITGTLDVQLQTYTEDNKYLPVITFPQLTAATTNLLIKKAAAVMSNLRIVATYSGACDFEVRARGIGTGEASVRILASTEGKASQVTVGTSTQLLIPLSLQDRQSMLVKNWSDAATLFVGFSPSEATVSTGYPILPGESLGLDMSAGTEVYAVGTAPVDVRIMEGLG